MPLRVSNPQPCFVGTTPSTGRPGWSNKGYPRGRHARALVKALADSLLGFWPRCPLSVGLSREHLFGLESTWLGSAPNTWLVSGPPVHRQSVPLQSACQASVLKSLTAGVTFQLPVGGTSGPTQGRRPEKRYRAPTRGTAFFCAGTAMVSSGGHSADWFAASRLMEVTTSWVAHPLARGVARSGQAFPVFWDG